MPNFFYNAVHSAPSFSSSSTHRKAQRMIVGAEIVANTLESFTSTNILIGKIPEFIVSLYNLVNKNTHTSEKIIHGLQAGIALTQACLAVAMFMSDEVCDNNTSENLNTLCKINLILNVIYRTLVTTSWLPGEMYKDPKAQLP